MNFDLTNTIAIAQLTTVLLVIAFLLAFLASKKVDRESKSSRRK